MARISKFVKTKFKIWQGIGEFVKTKTTKQPQPKSLHINNRIETNSLKIASYFKLIFNAIAAKIDERMISTSFALGNTLKEPTENTMFHSPTTLTEVESAVKELEDKKATSRNSIPSIIFKISKNVPSQSLCDLINLVFVCGAFPQQLKTAKIIPIYKKRGPQDCPNYCLISLIKSRETKRIINLF